jgi:hypothetical protein
VSAAALIPGERSPIDDEPRQRTFALGVPLDDAAQAVRLRELPPVLGLMDVSNAEPLADSLAQALEQGLGVGLEMAEDLKPIAASPFARPDLTRGHGVSGANQHRSNLEPVPAWTPDGSRIAFASARADKSTLNLWWQRADGTGDAQRLTESRNLQMPGSWHPNGKLLAFEEQNAKTSSDLMILSLDGDEASGWRPATPTVFLNSAAVEREPMFSPDGRWLAYSSDASGRSEVYVRPFPGPGAAVQISTDGGGTPTWSRKKAEIFYGAKAQITVVPYALERSTFRAGKPRLWSEGRYQTRGPNRMFDLHPAGERFVLAPATKPPDDHLTFVFNFFEQLRRLAPVTRQ